MRIALYAAVTIAVISANSLSATSMAVFPLDASGVEKELADLYAAADIMLSRAGATAVFEILALALPALLVPLPQSASRGDQLQNAKYFAEKGFAYVLPQERLTSETLTDAIDALYKDREILRTNMKNQNTTDAANSVAKIISDAKR